MNQRISSAFDPSPTAQPSAATADAGRGDRFGDSRPEAPRPFRLPSPDRLEMREGGGPLTVIGVPFLAVGTFFVLLGIRLLPLDNAVSTPSWNWPVVVVFGLVFVLIGSCLVFGRKLSLIDRAQGTIIRRWSLMVPVKRQELSLRQYNAVLLELEAGDSDSVDQYSVGLHSSAARGEAQVLTTSLDYATARQQAVYLAGFLQWPLDDTTSDHAIRLEPGQLHANLRERLGRDDRAVDAAPRPMTMRSSVEQGDGILRITIPGKTKLTSSVLLFVMAVGILIVAVPDLAEFFDRTHTPEWVQRAFLGFAALLFGVLPLVGLVRALGGAKRDGTVITVTRNELSVRQQATWRSKTATIPLADIVDIDYGTAEATIAAAREEVSMKRRELAGAMPPSSLASQRIDKWLAFLRPFLVSKGISVKSRQSLLTFGAGLPDDEIKFLHSLIRREFERW